MKHVVKTLSGTILRSGLTRANAAKLRRISKIHKKIKQLKKSKELSNVPVIRTYQV